MKPFTLIVLVVFGLVTAAVAVRLLGLAARTRKAPELLLGLSMLLPLVGYSIQVSSAVTRGGTPAPLAVEIGGLVVDTGFLTVAVFVWLVFRREEIWAQVLSFLLVIVGLAMPVVNHVVPWSNGLPSALWPRAVLRTICYGWAAVEALRYAALMRKRVRFGLAEPIVADRFVLWGVGHLCATLMLDGLTAGGALHVQQSRFADVFLVGGAAFGVPAMLAIGLSFFPPVAYVRYVERRLGAGEAS
ncbi:hypothetical protein [Polyangium sp. y55x31]|uniref:hypothetical protein n=1 Tax=Polyangium sp. y55x31 TaxID=3042688 RepID=UPI0024824EF5|nr:hypothetical protein [Polyangium sp. y55x31]MDI1478662.1 hypothetical protein [Polyangium sp. y55x31]